MIGCHTVRANRESYNAIKTMLKRDACSKSDCISDESGGCGEVVIADDLAGIFVRMDEFALSVSSQESACNSSSHLFVFNVTKRWTRLS